MFMMKLTELQPSQLYISSLKLSSVLHEFSEHGWDSVPPIPLLKLNGRIVMVDGHTRAVAAWLLGKQEVLACWDDDDLDLEAYRICVDWCVAEGITSPGALVTRVIAPDQYERDWYGRCREMHRQLKELRGR